MTDTTTTETPRGVRLNNPGNIRHDGRTVWVGQSPTQADPDFVTFLSATYGIRAMAKILHSYKLDGVATIAAAINRWAPASDDNDTTAYWQDVCARCEIEPTAPVDLDEIAPQLITAIIAHECANYAYPEQTILDGIALARGTSAGPS